VESAPEAPPPGEPGSPEREVPPALSTRDRYAAWGLFGATFAALFATEGAVGFVRDESVYFAAAESYANWFRLLFRAPELALGDGAIVRSWEVNHEHPVLMKTLFGLSHLLFHDELGWVRDAAAFRIPAFAAAALIPALLYLMGARLFGRTAALFAAASFVLVPRQFFHGHLAAFDIPMAATWLLTVYAFWRAQELDRGWIWTGLAFGLAIATKHNGFFIPVVLAPFAVWRAARAARGSPSAGRALELLAIAVAAAAVLYAILAWTLGPSRFQEQFTLISPQLTLYLLVVGATGWILWGLRRESRVAFRALAPLWGMAVLGPAVLYAHWPYLWHHPVDRVAWWMAFHLQHNNYTWFYLGRLLREPPFPLEYVVVVTALTVPVSIFLPMVLGFFSVAGRAVAMAVPRWRSLWRAVTFDEALVAVNALASIAIISDPSVPHFGGVKHWFPSMPFLSLLAGASVARATAAGASWLRPRWPRLREAWVAAPLFTLLLVPALVGLWRVHPYGTSFYGELAGGIPGAASLGMQRQFWSNNVTGVLGWIDEHAPRGARLYLHEVNGFSFRDYQRNGMLRPDLVPAGGPEDADLAAYQYHQEFREQEMNIWQAFGTTRPVAGLYVDETPQIVVFSRPQQGAGEEP